MDPVIKQSCVLSIQEFFLFHLKRGEYLCHSCN